MENYPFAIMNIWLFRYKLVNKSIIEWTLILTLACGCVVSGFFNAYFFLKMPLPSSRLSTVNYYKTAISSLTMWLQAIIIFRMKWSKFQEYINYMERIRIPKTSYLNVEIRRNRRNKFLIQLAITVHFQALDVLYFLMFGNFGWSGLFLSVLVNFGFFLCMANINDSAVCLAIIHKLIGISISDLKMIGPIELQRNRLVNLRKAHIQAVRATTLAEEFFRESISLYYFKDFFQIFVVCFSIFLDYESLQIVSIRLLYVTMNFLTFIFVSSNLNRVHVNSMESLKNLYDLSLKVESIELQKEIEFFLEQMSKLRVGFTFANLRLISPNFIASLWSVSLTLSLSLVTYVQY